MACSSTSYFNSSLSQCVQCSLHCEGCTSDSTCMACESAGNIQLINGYCEVITVDDGDDEDDEDDEEQNNNDTVNPNNTFDSSGCIFS